MNPSATESRVYDADDCTFSVPPGFKDRSVQVLEWSKVPGERLALVVQREPRRSGESLAGYVARSTRGHASTFAAYAPEDAGEDSDGASVKRIAFRWHHEGQTLFQIQAFVADGASVIIFNATAKARHRDDVERMVDEVIETLRLKER